MWAFFVLSSFIKVTRLPLGDGIKGKRLRSILDLFILGYDLVSTIGKLGSERFERIGEDVQDRSQERFQALVKAPAHHWACSPHGWSFWWLVQQFTLNGTQIISKNNSQCLSAGPQPCGRWANCNKSQAQTRRDNYILNVFVEACDSNNANQRWSLGAAPNSTLINFTPLNESAIEYPPPVAGLASIVQANSKQVTAVSCILHCIKPAAALCFVNVTAGLWMAVKCEVDSGLLSEPIIQIPF